MPAGDKRKVINPYNNVRVIDVYGPLVRFGGLIHVGTLTQQNGHFHFEYVLNDSAMVSRVLSGLNAVSQTTQDLKEWAFFARRLPSKMREDVRQAVERDGVDASRPMTLLAVFGAIVATDPRILVSRF